jgi:hypothetical protein
VCAHCVPLKVELYPPRNTRNYAQPFFFVLPRSKSRMEEEKVGIGEWVSAQVREQERRDRATRERVKNTIAVLKVPLFNEGHNVSDA